MSNKKWFIISGVILAALALLATVTAQAGGLGSTEAAAPSGAGFTYQGQLKSDGQPVGGECDMAFRLYDDAGAGSQVGNAITRTVAISAGLFGVDLDFGADVFDGSARWLEIVVQCTGDSGYASLGRQELTAAPYAHYALRAPWSGLDGIPAGFADGVDDVTAVISSSNIFAGDGLTQIANGNSVTMAVYFAGSGGGYGTAISVARSDHEHWGENWSGSGVGLSLSGDTGLYGNGNNYGVHGSSKAGTGVYGQITLGDGYGVYGSADGSGGYGVYASGPTGDLRLSGTGSIYADESAISDLEFHSNDHVNVHLDDDGSGNSYFRVFNDTDTSVFTVGEDGTIYPVGNGTIYATASDLNLNSDSDVDVNLDADASGNSYFNVRKDTGDVVFRVREDGDIWWQERTGYVSVSAAAFGPQLEEYSFQNWGAYLFNWDGDSDFYHAPVQLPHGVTVTRMTFYWRDESPDNGQAQLCRNEMDGTAEEMANAVTSGGDGIDDSFDDTINYATIDNSQYAYFLSWSLPNFDVVGYGVIIEYTYTGP